MSLSLCQLQPYQKNLNARVLTCNLTPINKEIKTKARASNKTIVEIMYDVTLDETILYPEGGGQPCDYGLFNDYIHVKNVYKSQDGQIIHQINTPLTVGQQVDVKVDWPRRYDHMQQHSSQHLISATFINLFDCHTVSWWLSQTSECYIEFDRPEITMEQLQAAEQRCNELIRAALPIHMHTYPTVEHALADEEFTSRLPKHKELGDHLIGTVRVIEIAGADYNLCGGTHVEKTSELQLICFTKTDQVKGNARVHFLAGDRALTSLKDGLKFTKSMTTLLSATGDAAVDSLKRVQLEQRNLAKLTTRQTRELAEFVGQQLFDDYRRTLDQQSNNRTVLIDYHRDDSNMLFLAAVVDRFNSLSQEHPVPVVNAPLLLLTCSDSPESKEGQFLLIGGPAEHLSSFGADVAAVMAGRGGGKGRIQGKANRIDERTKAIERINQRLNL